MKKSTEYVKIKIDFIKQGALSYWIRPEGETKGISRSEFEYPIPLKDAQDLLKQFAGNTIEKTRYNIKYKGKTWEVDIFSGENKGLILAEIELKSEDEKFDIPEWITEEVTGDERYYNSYLSIKPYKNW